MLKIIIPSKQLFDDKTQLFVYTKETELRLEHSLVSLSKWESKFCKPFLTKNNKTNEETLEYIKCMTITQNVDPLIYISLNQKEVDSILDYIQAPMTATTFFNFKEEKKSKEIITSEIIYYWMVTFQIPFECQTWHLNKLLALINVCSIKNQPKNKKKMGKNEILAQNKALNEARRKQLNTSG